MEKITLPYGKTGISFNIDEARLNGVFHAGLPAAVDDELLETERALSTPYASLKLAELARGKKNCVIIASDHTRPVPSRILMPALLRHLRQGVPDLDITILIATGCHRFTSREELIAKFGSEIVENEKIVVHDCDDASQLVDLGTLPSGGHLQINKLAVETDLLIAEGFIEPHFFAGFSGGRKSVLPGIAGRKTVLANHCAEFIQSPFARTGILENNPIHRDMLFAAEKAKLAFVLNVVINENKKIVRAFAGDPAAAHAEGCKFLQSHCRITVPESDIVITSNGGYPLDQNVYQSVKGMTAAEAVCRENGVIIIAAACNDGHGGEAFFRVLSEAQSPEKLLESIASIPRNKTTPDQWQYQILARIQSHFRVIVVTRDCSYEMLRKMKLETASSVEEALEMAYEKLPAEAKTAVIPDGVSVIAQKK